MINKIYLYEVTLIKFDYSYNKTKNAKIHNDKIKKFKWNQLCDIALNKMID